ncbi:MAG: prolyl oligopeptidase family serine peptidase [Chloroflexia bacterium]|nr:prolyl oligopeptidase family serine peptidase [Chloroflexia bacterium]
MTKKNTFKDIISCCEYLIDNQYTSKGRISIRGGSAGGLLVGSVVTMRPDILEWLLPMFLL